MCACDSSMFVAQVCMQVCVVKVCVIYKLLWLKCVVHLCMCAPSVCVIQVAVVEVCVVHLCMCDPSVYVWSKCVCDTTCCG